MNPTWKFFKTHHIFPTLILLSVLVNPFNKSFFFSSPKQLLTKPHILFCDEPTSGLDSFSALAVMNTLRELAGYVSEPKLFQKPPTQSRMILFSIHQPTSDIFHLFTNIILMSAGRIIFHGTVQEAQKLFTSIGLPCPQRYNPAEFYVNKISNPNVANDIMKHVKFDKQIDDEKNSTFVSSDSSDGEVINRTKVSWLRQVILLMHRSTLNFLHDPKTYLIELLILIVSSLKKSLNLKKSCCTFSFKAVCFKFETRSKNQCHNIFDFQ